MSRILSQPIKAQTLWRRAPQSPFRLRILSRMRHLTTDAATAFSGFSRPPPRPWRRWGSRQRQRWPALAPGQLAKGKATRMRLFGGHADRLGFNGQTLAHQVDVSPEVIELI